MKKNILPFVCLCFIFILLLPPGASGTSGSIEKDCEIFNACLKGDLRKARLLAERAGVNCVSDYDEFRKGWSPLHAAARKGYFHVIIFLVYKGADVNLKSRDLSTPLIVTAGSQPRDTDLMIVRHLVKAGARINDADEFGLTALHWAALWGKTEVMDFLIKNGADIHARDIENATPLHLAASGVSGVRSKYRAVKYLVEQGADINCRTRSDNTPLHLAAYDGELGIVKYLVSKGADTELKNKYGFTPVGRAENSNQREVIEYFRSAKKGQVKTTNTEYSESYQ